MLSRINQPRHFMQCLVILCALYFIVELFLNHYIMLGIDEFWFAHIIYHYQLALPYRDFAPYKTVLGYYLLLAPLLSSQGILQTLFFTKHCIALINTCIFFCSSWWLTRYFSRTGILLSLVLLMSSDIVLSFSTNIRVDLFGYWFCFFALLLFLDQRSFLAGLFLGLGFITTQKAIWYIFAADVALAISWCMFNRNKQTLLYILYANLMLVAVIAIYIAFWSWWADWNTVITSIFREASILYHLDWYDGARKLFWTNIILFNPLLMGLWPLTLLSIVVRLDPDPGYRYRVFAVIIGFIILLCLIPYKMIFPYYMQVAIPVLLILYAAFFAWLNDILNADHPIKLLLPSSLLWLFLIFYISFLAYIIAEFDLPQVYCLICLPPLLLGILITHHSINRKDLIPIFRPLILITFIFMGAIYPLSLIYFKMIQLNGDYQKAHIHVMNHLLQDGSSYVAGIELIYNKNQPIAGMRQLIGPAIDYLASPSAKLRSFMLASLYQDPNATAHSVIHDLKEQNVKFYVNTYRINALPTPIKTYLHSQYEHLWGSIYLYAPLMMAGNHHMMLKFAGRYLIEAPAMTNIILNGKSYHAQTLIELNKGTYFSMANHAYRLKLMPKDILPLLKQKFQREHLMKIVW